MAISASVLNLFGAGLLFAVAGFSAARAATLTNSDSTPVILQVAESGGRSDISIDPGASQEICPSGCFITLPNGDHVGLTGGEKVDIKGGAASVH